MRANGLWHPRLMGILTALGHGDEIVVADAGLPVPPGVEAIDLLWKRGEPRLSHVLEAVVAEAVFESVVAASELQDEGLLAVLHQLFASPAVTFIGHEAFKNRTAQARAVVRTGEDTPYANVILRAGVAF